MRPPSFQTALTVYAAIALLAGLTLDDPLRLVVILVMAGFALKTWLGHLRQKLEEKDEAQQEVWGEEEQKD